MVERDLGFYLNKAALTNPTPEGTIGQSGFFSTPASTLDVHIFGQDNQVLPDVRNHVINTLFDFWKSKGYDQISTWTKVFLAGSGASYQWSEARGNGDLDILLGFDYVSFVTANPRFKGLSEADVADYLNAEMHQELWPRTAETDFNGQTYELTYYVNPGTKMDIRNIHPYAAYDLSSNVWVVAPPQLPVDPHELYSADWYKEAANDKTMADKLTHRFNVAHNNFTASQAGTPGYINAATEMALVASQSKALFDDLHLGRKEAFRDGGTGYGDWHNFRWQVAKGSGAVDALHSIATIHGEAIEARTKDQYGQAIDPYNKALTRAAMWRWNR